METGDDITVTVVRPRIFRNTYRDSVELMRIAAEIERLPGVRRAALLMSTPANLRPLKGPVSSTVTRRPNDQRSHRGPRGDSEAAAEAALERAAELMTAAAEDCRPEPRSRPDDHRRRHRGAPAANLAFISTPGPYATAEALKALKRGLHVFLFSDNVPVGDEIGLKRLAVRKGLLLMGPDCGTAILDGVPLGFANVVRRGPIGLVGASGTGLQQVTCLIDRLGAGVSQAIGVGGRDLTSEVGGLTMLAGIERLAPTPTRTHRPDLEAARHRWSATCAGAARAAKKPMVVCFLGGDPGRHRRRRATPAATLEDAAALAVELAGARPPGVATAVRGRARPGRPGAGRASGAGQRAIRGLYSGGTLAYEAALLLKDAFPTPRPRRSPLAAGPRRRRVHGRPTPPDDRLPAAQRADRGGRRGSRRRRRSARRRPRLRQPPRPGRRALRPSIEARERGRRRRPELIVIGSVCGTTGDPAGSTDQEAPAARRRRAAGPQQRPRRSPRRARGGAARRTPCAP